MDQRLLDYIRANRERYTREAITEQLARAGHPGSAIDAAWRQVDSEGRPDGAAGTNLATYAWVLYWLGGGVIAVITLLSMTGTGGGPGFLGFGIGWLLAYLFVAYWPVRAFARARPMGAGGVLAVIIGVPLVVVLIGGGICVGTVLVILSGSSL